jgi:hypothetical protein
MKGLIKGYGREKWLGTAVVVDTAASATTDHSSSLTALRESDYDIK